MTKRNRTLFFVSIMAVSCSPTHEEFVVAGANPAPSGSCLYTPTTSDLLSGGLMPITWQDSVVLGSDQALHYYLALTLVNTLGAGSSPLASSNGQDFDTDHQYDVQITSADITFTTVGDGAPSSVPEVIVPATGYVPENGEGNAIFDIMSEASSKALLATAHTNFTLLANVTLTGITEASSPQVSNPFQFPISVTTDPVPTCTDNLALTFTGGPCGAIQDSVTAVCVDAGAP